MSINNNNNKNLSDLFKEVQDIRYGRKTAEKIAKPKQPKISKEDIKFNFIQVVDKKFNIIGAILGILFILTFFSIINSRVIFAKTEEEKVAISKYEENNNPINIMEVLSNNISETVKKEILTKNLQIQYETEYRDNNQMPTGEETIIQAGEMGLLERTVIISYENNEVKEERIINENIVSNPVTLIIEKGTSDYLKGLNAHIGDKLYTLEQIALKSEPNENGDHICNIYQFIDLTLISIDGNYAFINVDGIEGYVLKDKLTSISKNPEMKELARIQRLFISVNEEMPVNRPSGLTKEDFIKVLSNNSSDVNKIFENNAGLFYDIEQKYNINGLFLASIGIHESNWGTSTISINKKNLFGYGSYDSSSYASSYTFESYEYGIELVAKVLCKYYINEPGTEIYDGEVAVGSYYNGPTIGGVNVRYASDSNWSNRVYTIMKYLYSRLAE